MLKYISFTKPVLIIFEVRIHFYCIKCEYSGTKWMNSFEKSVYIDDSECRLYMLQLNTFYSNLRCMCSWGHGCHVKLKITYFIIFVLEIFVALIKRNWNDSFGKRVLITISARSFKISDKFLKFKVIYDLKYNRSCLQW